MQDKGYTSVRNILRPFRDEISTTIFLSSYKIDNNTLRIIIIIAYSTTNKISEELKTMN